MWLQHTSNEQAKDLKFAGSRDYSWETGFGVAKFTTCSYNQTLSAVS